MAISFPRVPLVSPGQSVTSSDWNSLADAGNERLRSGLADGPWRIMNYMLNLFKQIRNPDDSGFLFPPQAEFFQVYQMLNASAAQWPVAGPGEGEGANVASIMPAFVFGADAIDLDSEDVRVADEISGGVPLWLGLTVPSTPAEIWELGKRQRGAYDPTNGGLGSPSFTAAREHFKISPSLNSPHGNSYGGYVPAPVFLGTCSDGLTPNYQLFFTNLNDGSIQSYSGTCAMDSSSDVAFIARTPFAFWIFLGDGSVDVLLKKDWIEGPYTGGAWVMRQTGEQLPRVLNAFASEFRGSDSQLYPNAKSWLANAFDFQKFLTSQYHLAPNIGNSDGETIGPTYPLFRFSAGSTPPNTFAVHTQSSTQDHQYASGFTCVSCLITATKLKGGAVLKLWDNDGIVESFTIAPDSSGNFSQIFTFDTFPAGNLMEWQCTSGAEFIDGTGKIEIECTEILEYKPEIHDLYLTLRLASCQVNLVNGTDGSGKDETKSKEISDSYFANGCILNVHNSPGPAGSFAEINTNAVFDTARRLSQIVRIMPRRNFIGYEVADGKSICYFKRLSYLQGSEPIDLFEGIAPAREQIASGGIKEGRSYIVRSGQITYKGNNYVTDQKFTGESEKEFQGDGDGEVYEYEGIRPTAEKEGYSNEWVMGHQFKVYHQSDSSEWKPDAYSDYWFLSERCHFYHSAPPSFPSDLKWQFQYGESITFAPEAPTGWRYAKGTNDFSCGAGDAACEADRVKRYKSCRIYEPDPEIESATVLIEGGEEIVKLVFKTRFHSHDTLAPASIDRDVSTWNQADLLAEANDYRTVENGLREYLIWAWYGVHCTSGTSDNSAAQGNGAYNSQVWTNPDNPHGACFPDFYFVKLFEKVYEDTNGTQNPQDTPLWHDPWKTAEIRMRVMCEGYVDGRTSAEIGCLVGTTALFDYTFPNICFEAFGGQWFNSLPTVATQTLKAGDIREDAPQGFLALPNTYASAELFNQAAAVMNLMNRVRVMLPMKFEVQTYTGTTTKPFDAVWPSPAPSCTTSGPVAAYGSDTPPDPGASSISNPWHDSTTVSSTHSGTVECFTCSGGQWVLTGFRTDEEWRWNFSDPDAQYAIPETWRDMITTNGALLGVRQIVQDVEGVEHVPFAESTECSGIGGFWQDTSAGDYLKFSEVQIRNTEVCEVIPQGGRVSAEPMGKTILRIGRTAADESCCGGNQNGESITPILGSDMAFIEIPLT